MKKPALNVIRRRRFRFGKSGAIGHGFPFAAILMVFILSTAFLLTGCGGGSQSDSPQSGSVKLEAGAEVLTTSGTAASGTGFFNAGDLPLDAGRQLVYASNRQGKTAAVSFNLNGPWQFASGPDDASLTVTLSPIDSSPASEKFVSATIASGASWTTSEPGSEYNFQSKDDTTWYSYGRSFADGSTVVFSTPSHALRFPMRVGDSWIDTYTEVGSGKPVEVIAENNIVGFNRLTVPAGTYNAWLLQTKVTAKTAGVVKTTIDYSWFVPGIGRAAEIISQTDERQEVFDTAKSFYRLKKFS